VLKEIMYTLLEYNGEVQDHTDTQFLALRKGLLEELVGLEEEQLYRW
jgi:hypothetical protein